MYATLPYRRIGKEQLDALRTERPTYLVCEVPHPYRLTAASAATGRDVLRTQWPVKINTLAGFALYVSFMSTMIALVERRWNFFCSTSESRDLCVR